MGKYEDAIDHFNKTIELNPSSSSVYYNKGICLGKSGKYFEAIDCFDKAIELKPNYDLVSQA
jgi:tetratricopeptide (TPR) repeat protein